MGGSSKNQQTTQQVQIPPEVLARYNSVNAVAQQTAQTPFQSYSSSPDAFVAPVNAQQQSGIAATNAAAGQAQPYFDAATGQLVQAQSATSPYYGAATQDLTNAQGVGNGLAAGSLGALAGANAAANPLNAAAGANYGNAYANAQPFNAQAAGNIAGAQGVGTALGAGSLGTLAGASGASTPLLGQALSGIQSSAAGAQPYNLAATGLAAAGAGAVNASPLDASSIQQYMNPYLNTVLGSTSALLNQNNQQQQAGQLGSAITSGAFGGDRAGIAAANLEQQQNLANANIYSGIASNAYTSALGAAQQQQGVNLGAGQANRAALQTASGQLQGIGQQEFGQGQTAAQNTAGVAGQLYGQGLASAQQQAAVGQQLSGLDLSAAQAQAALGQQTYGQGMGLGTAQQGLASQEFGQGAQTASQLQSLGQQQFGQGVAASQQAAGIGQDIYGTGAATSQGLASLGSGAQAAALQGAQAQLGAGTLQQQTTQAGDTALYNQFLQQQSYPFQTAQFLANIAEGTGALSGSTTTTTQPGGFFSDERLKEDIKPIGKSFDGQNIYSFKYKGDPRTQVGLLAQETEKAHPDAVGLASGYKTVDYGKATSDAAEKGHFRSGGLVPANDDEAERKAYAYGGYPTLPGAWPGDISALLQSQAQMYAPYGGGGLYGGAASGAPHGGSSYVPSGNLPVSHLAVAGGLATPSNTPAQQAATVAKLASEGKGAADNVISMFKPKKATPDDDTELNALLTPPAPADTNIAGGLASGGVPDDGTGLPQLDIPDDKPGATSLALPGAPPKQQPSPFEDILGIAKDVAAFIPKKSGGRAGYATNGTVDDGSVIVLPDNGDTVPVDALPPGEGLKTSVKGAMTPFTHPQVASAPVNAPDPRWSSWNPLDGLDALLGVPRGAKVPSGPPPAPVGVGAAGAMNPVAGLAAAGTNSALQHAGDMPGLIGAGMMGGADPYAGFVPNEPVPREGQPNAYPVTRLAAPPAASASPSSHVQQTAALAHAMHSAHNASRGLPPPPPPPGVVNPVTDAGQQPAAGPGITASPQDMPPQGLASAAPTPPLADPSALPDPSQIRQPTSPLSGIESALGHAGSYLGDKLKDPNVLLSILSGIGAMGTAPTVHPGVALAAGLSGGVNAYQQLRQQTPEIAQTQAQTGVLQSEAQGILANAQRTRVLTAEDVRNLVIGGLIPSTTAPGPDGTLNIPGYGQFKVVDTGPAMSAASAPAGATAPSYNYLGDSGKSAASDAFRNYAPLTMGPTANPGAVAASDAARTEIYKDGQSAAENLPQMRLWLSSLAAEKGPISPGFYNGVKTQLAAQYNDVVNSVGLGQYAVDPDNLANAQEAAKMSAGIGAMRDAQAQQRSNLALKAYQQFTANPNMSRQAAVDLIAQLVQTGQQSIDVMNYADEYGKEAQRNGAPTDKSYNALDVIPAFSKDHDSQRYTTDWHNVSAFAQNPVFQNFEAAMSSPDPNVVEQAKTLIDNKYGKGFHRYFTGSAQ